MSRVAPSSRVAVIDNAAQTANAWVDDVATAFGTADRQFAYRVLRSWLHTLRDRLTVEATAHFAAQLPELLRGIYYDGWNPGKVPGRLSLQEYTDHFAREAGVSPQDVPKAAPAVTAALAGRLSPGQLRKAMDQLPASLRALLLREG